MAVQAPVPAFERWVHDIRNQLSVILGFSEMLLQDMETGDSKRPDIQEIHQAAGRAMDALSRPPQSEDGRR